MLAVEINYLSGPSTRRTPPTPARSNGPLTRPDYLPPWYLPITKHTWAIKPGKHCCGLNNRSLRGFKQVL